MWRSVDRGRLYWSKNNVEYIAKEKTKSKWVQFKTVPNINRTYCQWNAINLKKNLHYNIALQETAAIEWMKKNVELFTMFVTDAHFDFSCVYFVTCIVLLVPLLRHLEMFIAYIYTEMDTTTIIIIGAALWAQLFQCKNGEKLQNPYWLQCCE